MTFVAERREWEIRYWRRLLEVHQGNIREVSRESGYCRQQVYVVLRRLGIELQKPQWGNAAWRALCLEPVIESRSATHLQEKSDER